MTDKRLTITEADFEQKGSFCDTDSGNHYDNVSDIGKAIATEQAIERGDSVDVIDDVSPGDTYGVDQRFNIIYEEADGQGTYGPTKLGPGR